MRIDPPQFPRVEDEINKILLDLSKVPEKSRTNKISILLFSSPFGLAVQGTTLAKGSRFPITHEGQIILEKHLSILMKLTPKPYRDFLTNLSEKIRASKRDAYEKRWGIGKYARRIQDTVNTEQITAPDDFNQTALLSLIEKIAGTIPKSSNLIFPILSGISAGCDAFRLAGGSKLLQDVKWLQDLRPTVEIISLLAECSRAVSPTVRPNAIDIAKSLGLSLFTLTKTVNKEGGFNNKYIPMIDMFVPGAVIAAEVGLTKEFKPKEIMPALTDTMQNDV